MNNLGFPSTKAKELSKNSISVNSTEPENHKQPARIHRHIRTKPYKRRPRIIIREDNTNKELSPPPKDQSASFEYFPKVQQNVTLKYDKSRQSHLPVELTPDRWSPSGWRYRTYDIREQAYFCHPNKLNFTGKEGRYIFLPSPSNSLSKMSTLGNKLRNASTYKMDYAYKPQAASQIYYGGMLTDMKLRPNSRKKDNTITESCKASGLIHGSKFSFKDVTGGSINFILDKA